MLQLYNRIRQRREELGMTQDELAKKLGYKSRSSINKIEKGENDIPQSKIIAFANALETTPEYLMGWQERLDNGDTVPITLALDTQRNVSNSFIVPGGHRIPILGRIVAGTPIEAVEDIRGYIEIDSKMAKNGKYLALEVKGASMEPTLHEGDIIVVKLQEDIESGEMAVVMVNGDEATVKEVKESEAGLTLIGHNVAVYTPHFYSWEEVASLPIKIIGKVVELRRRL